MSADNWTQCPKCDADLATARKQALTLARASYGKVPAEDYEARIKAAKKMPAGSVTTPLREDYEIGIHDGEFSINYSASCNVCAFEFKFEEKKDVTL